MKTSTIVGIVVVLIVAVLGIYFLMHKTALAPTTPSITGASTTPLAAGQIAGRPQTLKTTSGISINYYADTYGLAVNQTQMPKASVIPACNQGFDYCFYRVASDYANTNFESAGLALAERTDLKTKQTCLTTAPDGYTNLVASTTDQGTFATSAFGPLSDAGAGHYSSGAQYRLWTGSTCEQFTMQIGETQFANYPAGTKQEFTAQDLGSVKAELNSLLFDAKLNGTKVKFPGI